MVRFNVLADALRTITNAERLGKRQVMIRPASKVITEFLNIMMKHQYITDYTVVDNHRSGKIVVNLNGRLNKCAVISPRYNIALDDFDKWEANLLPSRHFGALVLTTSYGIMDNNDARKKHTGGKILGFFY